MEAAKLPTRYQSGYNVMGTSTKPPYTTITAYDLNTGEIKWQVPNGDDPATVEMTTTRPGEPCRAAGGCVPGGVRDTGGVGARYGMVVTKSGLLFQISKDRFARAYDVDTGKVLWKGKKNTAREIVYGALEVVEQRTSQDPSVILKRAVDNVRPQVEVRSRRVGGSSYQVPVEVSARRQETLAIRWLVNFARQRREPTMAMRLANEILDASNYTGAAIKRKEDVHKMAESNKAFAHYRW